MERMNGLKIFPDENDMTGDTLEIRTDRKQSYKSTYKIKIARSQFVEGDPHIKCSTYSLDNSYDDCTRKELLDTFHELLGCSPPLLGKDHTKTCNERFNVSMNIEAKLKKMFLQMYEHDVRFECKMPCSKDKYTSKLVHQVPSRVPKIMIVFERTLSVTRSTFSISGQTFLTRLGGAVSSGRTLLWILASLIGAFQILKRAFLYYQINISKQEHRINCDANVTIYCERF